MKQCPECKTFKKADNCIKCATEARREMQRAENALRNIKDILDAAKNDNNKIILIETEIKAYKDYNKIKCLLI